MGFGGDLALEMGVYGLDSSMKESYVLVWGLIARSDKGGK